MGLFYAIEKYDKGIDAMAATHGDLAERVTTAYVGSLIRAVGHGGSDDMNARLAALDKRFDHPGGGDDGAGSVANAVNTMSDAEVKAVALEIVEIGHQLRSDWCEAGHPFD